MATEEQAHPRACYAGELETDHPEPRPCSCGKPAVACCRRSSDERGRDDIGHGWTPTSGRARINRDMRDLARRGRRARSSSRTRARATTSDVGQHRPAGDDPLRGSTGYYSGGLNDGADIVVERNVGWGARRGDGGAARSPSTALGHSAPARPCAAARIDRARQLRAAHRRRHEGRHADRRGLRRLPRRRS